MCVGDAAFTTVVYGSETGSLALSGRDITVCKSL
jgi:hypothetical protein